MRYLKSVGKVSGKTCLLRTDFNIKDMKDPFKIEKSIPTIKFLLNKGVRVVILSHRGRPKASDKKKQSFSLKPIKSYLEKKLKRKIVFLDDIPGKLPNGDIFLLENLRFFPGEEKNDLLFARKLVAIGDFFVNEAFAVSHRKNSSFVNVPKYLASYAGLLFESEIKHLSKAISKPKKPLIVIFGGAKIKDKAKAIKNLLPKAKAVLVGSSIINDKNIGVKSHKIIAPVDWLSNGKLALDIGPITIELFSDYIKSAKTIIWSGPPGKFEDKKFQSGSYALARLVANSKALSIVGGGETTQIVKHLKLEKRYSFISTGGGAMLAYLSGKKMPGIAALEQNSKLRLTSIEKR